MNSVEIARRLAKTETFFSLVGATLDDHLVFRWCPLGLMQTHFEPVLGRFSILSTVAVWGNSQEWVDCF